MLPVIAMALLLAGTSAVAATTDKSEAGVASATSAYLAPPRHEPPPPLPDDPVSRQLVERVQSRWQALVEGDFLAAYAYEEPDYRARHDVDAYRRRFGDLVRWHGAEVRRIQYNDEESVQVGVVIDRTVFPPFGGQTIRSEGFGWENWIRIDGEWWHQSRWSNIPGAADGDASQQQ